MKQDRQNTDRQRVFTTARQRTREKRGKEYPTTNPLSAVGNGASTTDRPPPSGDD